MNEQDAIEERQLDGRPLTTFAEYLHQLNSGNPEAGVLRARVNMRTILGGFFSFKGNEAQNRAAAIVKTTWERSIIGGARAVDPSVEPVDGGYRNPEAVFEQGADARKLKARIEDALGDEDTGRLLQVVIVGLGPTAYAKWRYRTMNKPNTGHIKAGVREMFGILDRLADELDLTAVGASRGTRADGETPQTFVGTISTRRAA